MNDEEMLESMSIHTIFVCLLHLANEHRLFLEQFINGVETAQKGNFFSLKDGFEDFKIAIEI